MLDGKVDRSGIHDVEEGEERPVALPLRNKRSQISPFKRRSIRPNCVMLYIYFSTRSRLAASRA